MAGKWCKGRLRAHCERCPKPPGAAAGRSAAGMATRWQPSCRRSSPHALAGPHLNADPLALCKRYGAQVPNSLRRKRAAGRGSGAGERWPSLGQTRASATAAETCTQRSAHGATRAHAMATTARVSCPCRLRGRVLPAGRTGEAGIACPAGFGSRRRGCVPGRGPSQRPRPPASRAPRGEFWKSPPRLTGRHASARRSQQAGGLRPLLWRLAGPGLQAGKSGAPELRSEEALETKPRDHWPACGAGLRSRGAPVAAVARAWCTLLPTARGGPRASRCRAATPRAGAPRQTTLGRQHCPMRAHVGCPRPER